MLIAKYCLPITTRLEYKQKNNNYKPKKKYFNYNKIVAKYFTNMNSNTPQLKVTK